MPRRARPGSDRHAVMEGRLPPRATNIAGCRDPPAEVADRLLRAVTQQRRMKELVADRFRIRRANTAIEDVKHQRAACSRAPTNLIASSSIRVPSKLIRLPLVEIELGLARDDRGQMKNHIGAIHEQLFGGAGTAKSDAITSTGKPAFSGFAGATTSCSVIRVMSRLARRPSRNSRSDNCGRPCRPHPELERARDNPFLLLLTSS